MLSLWLLGSCCLQPRPEPSRSDDSWWWSTFRTIREAFYPDNKDTLVPAQWSEGMFWCRGHHLWGVLAMLTVMVAIWTQFVVHKYDSFCFCVWFWGFFKLHQAMGLSNTFCYEEHLYLWNQHCMVLIFLRLQLQKRMVDQNLHHTNQIALSLMILVLNNLSLFFGLPISQSWFWRYIISINKLRLVLWTSKPRFFRH